MDCYVYCHIMLSNFVIFSLTEQGVMRQRQEQKVNELTKKLEKTTFDRDSFEKKYKMAQKEMERVRSEMAHSQAEWASYSI